MKKFALAVVVVAIAASPAMAAKKHQKKRAAAPPASVGLNDNSFRLVRDSLPLYLPTFVKMVIYPVGNNQK